MRIDRDSVAICMATYNGEKFLSGQINSILKQTYQNWTLFVRDDNSTDNTMSILRKFHEKYPEKIILVENDGLVCKSAKKNFAAALKWVTGHYDFQYFMFSDQDDVWLEKKVEKSLALLKKYEERDMKPYLFHTDLCVVDQDLNVMGESFFSYRALNCDVKDVRHLLVQNNITGCTMLWNKAFNDIIDISDDQVAMHDWWMAIIASLKGEIICLKEATILYRQHGGNVVGATNVNSVSFIIKRLTGASHVKETFQLAFDQAEAIMRKYRDQLTKEQVEDIEEFIRIRQQNKFKRVAGVLKKGYKKQGIVQIIGEIIFI